MKQILLLSDTHNHLDATVLKYAKQADEIWHAGDIGTIDIARTLEKAAPVLAVYGNIDGAGIRAEYPEELDFECERMRVFMTHIGGYPGRYPAQLKNTLLEKKPDIFICGHSHILKVIWDKKHHLLHLNPGAVGKYGFHKVRTMLRFAVDGNRVRNLEIIEINK